MLKLILIAIAIISFILNVLIFAKLKKMRFGIVEHFSLQTIFAFVLFYILIFGILVKLTDALFITIF